MSITQQTKNKLLIIHLSVNECLPLPISYFKTKTKVYFVKNAGMPKYIKQQVDREYSFKDIFCSERKTNNYSNFTPCVFYSTSYMIDCS